MNKFIKAKIKRINAELAKTFLLLTGSVFELDTERYLLDLLGV